MTELAGKGGRRHRLLWPCLVVNGLMIVFLGLSLLWLNAMSVLNASITITAIDRQGAIDEVKVQQVYPAMTNLRHDLAEEVVRSPRGIGNLLGILGIAGCVFNMAMAMVLSSKPALPESSPGTTESSDR